MRWAELPEFAACPDGWEVTPLAKKADFLAGQSPDSEYYNDRGEGVPFLQGNADFGAKYPSPIVFCTKPTKLCDPGDTLISVRAPVGALNRADQRYGLGRGLAAIQARTVEPDYLYYAMARWHKPLRRAAQGSTFDAITARQFRQLSCCLPTHEEERLAIVQRLSAADDAVTASETKLVAARRLKIALLQRLLTQGVPGRHTRFKPTKVGEIPESWDVIPLHSVATTVSGIALNSEREARSHPCRYMTVINVQRERLDLSDVRYMEVHPEELPDALLMRDDIVVVEGHANSSEIGRAALITDDAIGFAYQNHLFRIRLLPESRMIPLFLLSVLNSERVRRHWAATCNTSSGLNTINRRGLRRLLVQRPTPDEQRDIADLVHAANETISACQGELNARIRLKQSLLQNLLTGKVRLKV
jgi:type I restriction enzyme, S subunit